MNSLAMTKLMSPQAGKVKNQVNIMSLTTPKLMAERRLTAPTPMMAQVLMCVEDTGMPVRVASSRFAGAREVGGEALILLELNHALADGLDDALTAHAGADTHGGRAQQHNPDGDAGIADAGLAVCEGHA